MQIPCRDNAVFCGVCDDGKHRLYPTNLSGTALLKPCGYGTDDPHHFHGMTCRMVVALLYHSINFRTACHLKVAGFGRRRGYLYMPRYYCNDEHVREHGVGDTSGSPRPKGGRIFIRSSGTSATHASLFVARPHSAGFWQAPFI